MTARFHEMNPEALVADPALDPAEKSRILHEWEQDEIALLRATDESMPVAGSAETASDFLRRVKRAEDSLRDKAAAEAVHEMVAFFKNADDLQAAMDDLLEGGFVWQDLSLLAGQDTVREKLGRVYRSAAEAADDPKAPRTTVMSRETMGNAMGTVIGLPLYIAATTAVGIAIALEGSLPTVIFTAIVAGLGGAAIGLIVARMIFRHRAIYIQEQNAPGGLLLWVRLRAPEMERKAEEILARHHAFARRVHDIAV